MHGGEAMSASARRSAGATGREAEQELGRQKQRLEPVLEISPTAIIITDLDTSVVAWNRAAERLFGYTSEEAIGRNLDDLVAKTKELHTDAVAFSKRTSKEKDHIHTITRRTRKDGGFVDVELLAAPLIMEGEAIGVLGFYHDITELNRQQRFFEALLEVSPEAIVTVHPDNTVASWNPAAERLFGYTASEAIGTDITALVARREDLYAEGKELDRLADEATGRKVTQRIRKDGSLVDVDIVGGPVTVGGELVGKHVFYHDITELQQQKRYFQSLLEISPVAIMVTDLEMKVASWNPAAEKLFGYSAEEAIGSPLDDLVATRPELHHEAVGYSQRAAQGERVQAISRRTGKDGSLVDVQIVTAPVVVNENRVGFLAIYNDITEIQRQKRYYEALVEFNPGAIVLVDSDGMVTSWNPAAERLFGYTADEAIGQNIDDLVATSEEIRAEAEAYTEQGIRGNPVHAITRRTRKDGTLVDVELFAAPVIEARDPAGTYGMYHDIRELQRARRDAEAATEAKSAFVATMSHEIRTPLNAVIGMTGLLLDTELTAEQRNYAEVTRSSADALLGVIGEILDFSKIEAAKLDLEHSPFDLRDCVESALELVVAVAMKKGLDLACDLDPDVPPVLVGDVTRVRQILVNLLNNAVKFTERGEVVVTVAAERLDPDDRHRLHFAVRDTGIGIPKDRMDRLFEPFSQVDPSTTRRYGGTGLGLAISKRLAQLMNGTMWAESRAGAGSTFHFTIEAAAAPGPVRAYERAAPSQLAGKRVLIVAGNATNRHILARQTESWGMLQWETGSPALALESIRRGDPYDVAILDMQISAPRGPFLRMHVDGLTLAGDIRRYRDARALPLVLLTSLGRTEGSPTLFAAYLTKPIKPSQLYRSLMEVFGTEGEMAERPVVAREADEGLARRPPLRILVVEDNPVNQQLALLLLQKVGYRADVAGNGVEALQALERQPYDIVLMDVEMPEMDGLEATRSIRAEWPRDRQPYVVAMTANVMTGDRELCLEAGMNDFVGKPVRLEELAATLDRARSRAGWAEAAGDAAPSEEGAGSVLDPAALGQLKEEVGEEGLAAVIGTFLEEAPRLLGTLLESLDRGDAEEMRRCAHTLKSNAASFGASVLSDLCRDLESTGRRGDLTGAPDLFSRVEAEYARARDALSRLRRESGEMAGGEEQAGRR
jgi:PAS domain S-box-containing protein